MNDKLNALISDKPSGWKEKAEYRKANRDWLSKSGKIALKVLRELRAKSITQKELAERINVTPQHVSKLLKGHENLSLETICKLEYALGISLIVVPTNSINIKLELETGYIDQSQIKINTDTINKKLHKNYSFNDNQYSYTGDCIVAGENSSANYNSRLMIA